MRPMGHWKRRQARHEPSYFARTCSVLGTSALCKREGAICAEPSRKGPCYRSAAQISKISLYFSLLAGNSGRRPVRTRLRRQPTSTVSTHRCRYQEKEAAFAGLFACTSQAPCSPFQKSKRNTARSLRQPFELFPNFGDATRSLVRYCIGRLKKGASRCPLLRSLSGVKPTSRPGVGTVANDPSRHFVRIDCCAAQHP